jgi:hypothetical protein
MFKSAKTILPVVALLIQLAFIFPAAAQGSPSKISQQYASRVSGACLGNWESQACLKAVSESSLAMVSRYAETLKSRGGSSALETLKQKCAASTAAITQNIPANAMRSAYTECANAIYDISEQTGVKPDQSHYQLLVGPVLCLSKDRRCSAIEQGLRRY